MNAKKYAAEAIGTFWLTFAGCGSAVIAAAFPQVGIGLVGVSLAFGLSVVTMAYAIGHISGCHLNPAVTVGLAAGGRFPAGQIAPYVIAQVVGAVAAAALLYVIASGAAGFDVSKGFASNGFGEHSPGKRSGTVCRWMGHQPALAFLGGAAGRRRARRRHLPMAERGAGQRCYGQVAAGLKADWRAKKSGVPGCAGTPPRRVLFSTAVRRGRSGPDSSPWSMPRRSPSRTSLSSRCTHRLPRRREAASATRRSGRHGCPST
jgi:hypothetical protein